MEVLVKESIAAGPATVVVIANEIVARDRSLDIKTAQTLAKAAVEIFAYRGSISVRGAQVYDIDGGQGLVNDSP